MTSPAPVNIAAHLPLMARSRPHAPAIFFPEGRGGHGRMRYSHLTFRQLDKDSNLLADGLERIGIGRGVRAVLMVPPSPEFFALTFALFKVGAVPVLVDPGMGLASLKRCLAEARPEAFIGVTKAHVARLILGWAREHLTRFVTVGARIGWGGHGLEDLRRLADASAPFQAADTQRDDPAAILFTSGSTGSPKGAVYRHGNFAAQVEALKEAYGIEPGEVDLPTFPLFGLFGPALGMTAVIPQMDFTRPAQADPGKLFEAIEDFGVTNMFGSPALLDRLGRYGDEKGVVLPSLRRVISAGAPVQPTIIERFSHLLRPGTQVHTPYGATEGLPVSTIGSDEILGDTRHGTDEGQGTCVGTAVPGVDVRIIRIDDGPIEEWDESLLVEPGSVGEIAVRGPQVTAEYFGRPEATQLAKIKDDQGGFFHRMGDLGYIDAQSRIWFCGRKAHRVETKDETLFTIPCEAVFNAHPSVRRSALVGIPGDNAGARPIVCIELDEEADSMAENRLFDELRALGAKHVHTRGLNDFVLHPSFPVDIRHNAKIFREKLAVWAQDKFE